MSSAQTTPETVRRTVIVPCPVERAFEIFTDEIAGWWPLDSHAVDGERSRGVRFEPGPQGRIVEQLADGTDTVWGHVLTWDPPHNLVFSWHPGQDYARTQAHEATEVGVRFTLEGDGTRVELDHHGWERLGARGEETREGYDSGWKIVLGRYEEALTTPAS